MTRAISDYAQTLSKTPAGLPSFGALAFRRGLGPVDTAWSAVRIGLCAQHLDNWLRHFPVPLPLRPRRAPGQRPRWEAGPCRTS